MTTLNTAILDNLIIGRIEPHIYAFTTNTVPNYLKIGDTYRPVNVRIDEWRLLFPNLEHEKDWEWLAKTSNGKYYRDYAIHYYLETIKRLHRLQPNDFENLPYYSREFFEKATPKDIDEAILDIEEYAKQIDGSRQYQFYSEERLPEETHFAPTETYKPRPNQEETIKSFIAARKKGRKNLLMYAVMRFGKSFTSMCCATEMKAKVVLVVSAKADVMLEWQKTVESHTRFADYVFLGSNNLKEEGAISKKLVEGKRVVVFLTLQDLMGDDIKEKHKDLFHQDIDLLIVDETHFGARAEEYGKVLRNVNNLSDAQIRKEQKQSEESTFDDLEKGLESIKALKVDTTLHLSGTPYRILMGSEFKPDDIIAFYQFTDIIDDKEKWDIEHQEDNEWENPYYGFPQMVRFAFNPSDSARKLIAQLKSQGKTSQLNELFRPQSIAKDTTNKSHLQFVHEKEVLDLIRVIDGSEEDDNLLGFLDYDKLKDGKMCRHIVMVLPFCASCDAMEKLINNHKNEFNNLCDYTIVNIAGHESTFDTTEEIKAHIRQLESEGKKSITLTVNRMLTGSTVREWDTMIFLKDVSSPQEYDQAIFRLQNQYVTTYKDDKGDAIKYNMKPQTLLVDFDPNRMFRMQEQKSMIYNVNTNERGNDELEMRLKRELEISPIIVINKGKIAQVTPTNIMDAVRDYSANLTVMDEACDVPIDFELLNDPNLLEFIKDLDPISNKKGINIKPSEGEGNDYDSPEDNDNDDGEDKYDESKESKRDNAEHNEDDDQRDKRLATFFAQILFFALLTDDRVKSLNEVIEAIRHTDENRRIMHNVGLNFSQLLYLKKHINPQILSNLDYKIQNINDLLHDTTHEPLERVERALKKFGRLSVSEIVTPSKVADDMVSLLPKERINAKTRFLDIASKQGEFACALYKRFGASIKDSIYALPTSKLTYEFTYKVFKLLDIPTKNIFETFNTYDLIGDNKDTYTQILKDMKFDVVIGNPPYQDIGGSGGTNDSPIYQYFYKSTKELKPALGCFITPSRWFAAGRDNLLGDFRQDMLKSGNIRKMVASVDSKHFFPSVEIKGGSCYFLADYIHTGTCDYNLLLDNKEEISADLDLSKFEILIRDPRIANIVERVVNQVKDEEKMVDSLISSDTPFGIPTKPVNNKKQSFGISVEKSEDNEVILYYIENLVRKTAYLSKDKITKNTNDIDKPKVFVPEVGGSGKDQQVLGIPLYAPAPSVCSQSYLYTAFDIEEEALNFLKYLKTKFLRILVSARKITQHATSRVYCFVPVQNFTKASDIDWSKPISDIDKQLYAKYGLSDDEVAFIESRIKPME
ncbi:MAG: Eco57I restriction-modification methylase domain-containing protein [Bacteroidales bacterium]|nr:Eco57I restriction-modification methylase domain-containing protein [Bacteroidales bacterium]